jgi:hypothetical protein
MVKEYEYSITPDCPLIAPQAKRINGLSLQDERFGNNLSMQDDDASIPRNSNSAVGPG